MTLTAQLSIDRRLAPKRTITPNAARLFRNAPSIVKRAADERKESLDDFTAAAHESIVQEILRHGTIQGEQL